MELNLEKFYLDTLNTKINGEYHEGELLQAGGLNPQFILHTDFKYKEDPAFYSSYGNEHLKDNKWYSYDKFDQDLEWSEILAMFAIYNNGAVQFQYEGDEEGFQIGYFYSPGEFAEYIENQDKFSEQSLNNTRTISRSIGLKDLFSKIYISAFIEDERHFFNLEYLANKFPNDVFKAVLNYIHDYDLYFDYIINNASSYHSLCNKYLSKEDIHHAVPANKVMDLYLQNGSFRTSPQYISNPFSDIEFAFDINEEFSKTYVHSILNETTLGNQVLKMIFKKYSEEKEAHVTIDLPENKYTQFARGQEIRQLKHWIQSWANSLNAIKSDKNPKDFYADIVKNTILKF